MSNDINNYSDILFGYLCTPSYGLFGKDDGGFSVSVYADGRLLYKNYIFDNIEKTKTEYKLLNNSINEIKTVIEEYQSDINNFVEYLDNGSCDGVGNFFVFNGKQFITWNIKHTDENEIKKINPQYYNCYYSVINQQNKMLLIFDKIVEILKGQGIHLKIDEVIFNHRAVK